MSVKRRPDTGLWEVRWREGGRHRGRSFHRKGDADAFWDEVRRLKRLGRMGLIDAGATTLAEFVEEYWRLYAVPRLAPKTRQVYGWAWEKHARRELGGRPLRDLTPMLLDQFVSDLADAGVGQAAIGKTLTMLQSVFKRAVVWGYLPWNPMREVGKPRQERQREIIVLAPERVEQLRARLGKRDAALVSVLAYAGLRPHEAMAVHWEHVGERRLWVPGEAKTHRGRRSVRLLPPLAQDLAEWRLASGHRTGLVFQGMSFDQFRRRRFSNAAAALKLDELVPYDLRHGFVSLLIWEGRPLTDVAEQAGHSVETCARTYAHVLEEFDPERPRAAEASIQAARQARVHERYATEERPPL